MAFKNVGPVTFLAQGQTASWTYSYAKDMGSQFACADIHFIRRPPRRSSPVFLADQQRLQRQTNFNITYFVNITNQGPGFGAHNLQGGGLT